MCESYCTLKLEYSWNNAGFTVTLFKKKFPSNIEQLGRLIDCYTTIYRTIQNISCMTCVVNVPRSQGESLSSSPLSHMHRMDRNGLSGTLLSNGDTWARKNKQTFHYNQDCGSALIFCGSGSSLKKLKLKLKLQVLPISLHFYCFFLMQIRIQEEKWKWIRIHSNDLNTGIPKLQQRFVWKAANYLNKVTNESCLYL